MKLSLKYALAVSLILICFVTILLFVTFNQFAKITRANVLNVFKLEVEALAKYKHYEPLFATKPSFGYYYVLNSDGVAIFHTEPSKVGIDAKQAVPGLFEYMKKRSSGIYSYVFEGVERHIAFAYDGESFIVHAATKDELFRDLQRFRKRLFAFGYPLLIVISLVLGYIFGEYLVKTPKSQLENSNKLFGSVSEAVIAASTSTAEIKAMAENTEKASLELDKSVEEFAAYLEESRAEVESTLLRIKHFTDTIEDITKSSSKLAELTETLSSLAEKITDISDNITVLAINASIETSKQNIDREGLARIAEMIMDLSNSTRNLAKESKNSLTEIEKVVTSTVLVTEKVSKDLHSVRESLNAIEQVTEASSRNVDRLAQISRSSHEAVEQLYAGIEQLENAINDIKDEIEKFGNSIKNIKL